MITFIEVEESDAALIGKWRTSEHVTKFLNTDIEFDLESQVRWIKGSRERNDYYHWLICDDGRPVGHMQITNIDLLNGSAEWGYFIGDESAVGIGGFIPQKFYSYAFHTLQLNFLNAEILHINLKVIALHQMYGYVFTPSRDRIVEKDGKDYLSISMRLDRETYIDSRFNMDPLLLPVSMWIGNPFN